MAKLTAVARRERLRNAERLRLLVRRTRPLAPLPTRLPGALTWRAVLLAGTMLSAHAAFAQTLPQGGQVVAGGATIAQPTANQMLINQSTQRVAINWQSFNIGAGYGVQFVQPSSSAIALNRVVGLSGPSQILGSLTANGQVYIVNPQGVVFGKGAMVNVGALLATTRNIDTAQFMAGGDITLAGGSTGSGVVKNAGSIATAPGGYVVLAGDKVTNKGTIDTPGGRTVLAAGDQATVALSNGLLVNVTMNASVANATVRNSGVIKAEGGKVVLSANGAGTVIGGAINLTGTVDVSAALAGDITIDAGPGGTVNATGATLKAVSTAGKGGNVTLAGDRVGLFAGTKVNASGTTGGGTVLAGGGVQGKDAGVRNASVTVLDPTSSIDASATDKGDGGRVVLWSQDYTGFYGTITAQGGPNGGNGGWVETSSHDNLQAWGTVDAHAPIGEGGSWLLDPSNVTIAASANVAETFTTSNGTWSASQPNGTINVAALNAQLDAGTNVTITTASANSAAGNININASIAKTGGGNASLTLIANGSIVDNGMNISSTSNRLNLTMTANNGVTLANGSAFFLNGGTLNITGGNASNAQVGVNIGQTTINAAAATIIGTTNGAAFAVNVFGALDASGTPLLTINGTNGTTASVNFGANVAANDLVVNARAKTNGNGIVAGTTLNAAGNLTLNGTGVGNGAGVLVTGSACSTGNLTINGTANNGIAVNVAGTLNASAGNVTINGTANNGRGVRLSGTISAAGTVNITGSANDANGIAVPGNLTLAAAGGATLTGTGNTANGINISATLDAGGTPVLTLNGCTSSGGGSNLTFFGVNISGTLNAADLTIIGRGLSGADDIGGVGLTGSIFTSRNLAINGTANNGIGVNLAGVVNASGGNVTITGTSNTGRGVRLGGTIAASGTVNATGTANDANGLAVPVNLTLRAAAGAFLSGTANTANGINISATLNASGTPVLTLNGTTSRGSGDFYGVNIAGAVNAVDLVMIGRGLSATADVGGVTVTGSALASGNMTINGSASNGTGVNITGTLNASNGSMTIAGTSCTSRGVRLAGTIAAAGTVDVTGGADGAAAGIGVAANLTLAAAGGATLTGTANAANGINISAFVNATGTPLLTLNGTSTGSDGGFYGVNITGNLNVASLTVNGVGNLSAAGNVGGTTVSGTLNAAGDVTLNGRSGGTFAAVFFTGSVAAGGNIVLNGAGDARYGVNVSGTLNASGTVAINGSSSRADGVFVNSSLTLGGSRGATITGSSSTGLYGVHFTANSTLSAAGLLVVNGTGGANYGVALDGTAAVAGLTVNGNNSIGGIEASGCLTSTGNVTLNANRITLNGATFRGTGANVVLQALDSTRAMSVNGSGANFGNVASVVIGGASQAAALNLAVPLAYGGAGNLSVVTGAANILLNGDINASVGTGSVILSAGNGVPLDASLANGNVTGGDVVVGSATSLAAGEGGSVVIYSGNANSAAFAPLVANGSTSQTKLYATLAGAGAVCTSSALNLFYRVVPNLNVTLGNATGANVGKTYDGVGVALGFGVTGMIDGDSASSISMTGGALGSNLPLTAGQALHAGNYTISQGTATFAATHNYAVSVVNGTIVIDKAPLTVTAGGGTKVYDGTIASTATATVCGTIAGDSFTNASLAESYTSTHVLGAGNSTLNVAAPLTNASFAGSTAGSFITDYSVSYVTAAATITPRALAVNATSDTKVFDGTTSSSQLMTVSGNIAGDTFTSASRAQVFASPAVAGTNNSILLPAAPLNNASFATSTAGSWITDYSVTYTAASGTILPSNGGGSVVAIVPPVQVDGLLSANVVALGSWLNSGGLQQNIPAGLALNDNVLHLLFTTSSSGQPLIQASWEFFNANFSGTINLPANVSAPAP